MALQPLHLPQLGWQQDLRGVRQDPDSGPRQQPLPGARAAENCPVRWSQWYQHQL